MDKYTGIFNTSGDVRDAVEAGSLHNPYMAIVKDGSYMDWNTQGGTPPVPPEPVYSAMPLTFEIISGGTITWLKNDSGVPSRTISYSINGGEWIPITSNSAGVSFSVATGDIVQFIGDNSGGYGDSLGYGNTLKVDGYFKLYGNAFSLISSTGFTEVGGGLLTQRIPQLFKGNTGLTEVVELSIGSNNISNIPSYGLKELFSGCANLNYIKIMMVYNTMVQSQVKNITAGVSSTGTFVKPADMTRWPSGASGIPTGWTVEDAVL